MTKPKIIGVGELLWDILPSGKQLGGAPANFAYHVRQLGGEGYIISAVGDDSEGKEIRLLLAEKGMPTEWIAELSGYPTGTVTVTLNETGIPKYTIHENVAWDHIPESNAAVALAGCADVFCFGSLAQRNRTSAGTIHALLARLPKHCLKVLDANLRQSYYSREVLLKSLSAANVLKLNDEELPIVTSLFSLEGDEQSVLQQLSAAFDLRLIVVTKGPRGSLLFSPAESSWLDTPRVVIADTVGAGDSFTAAVVMGLVNGFPLKRIHELAVEVAAYVCTQHGAMPAVPERLIQKCMR